MERATADAVNRVAAVGVDAAGAEPWSRRLMRRSDLTPEEAC
jgi:hypothetical protein